MGFSIVFLVLLGVHCRATHDRIGLGQIKLVQYYVPGFAAYGIMSACFTVLAITLVNRREMGLLKRLRLSPVPTWVAHGGHLLSTMIIALVQVVILLAVGRLGFCVHGPANVRGVPVGHRRGHVRLHRPRRRP